MRSIGESIKHVIFPKKIWHFIKVNVHWRKIETKIFNQNCMITLSRRVLACRTLTTLCLLLLVFENKAIFLLVFGLATFLACLFTGIGGKTSGLSLEKCIFLFLPGMRWFPLRNHVDCTNIRIFIRLIL